MFGLGKDGKSWWLKQLHLSVDVVVNGVSKDWDDVPVMSNTAEKKPQALKLAKKFLGNPSDFNRHDVTELADLLQVRMNEYGQIS